MFQYNRFWHFWFQLNNRHYLRASTIAVVTSLLLIPAAIFVPPLWGLVVAFPLVVAGIITVFTKLSNFFYNRQHQQLEQIKAETTDEILREEIDLYLDRRVICPQELLSGAHLELPDAPSKKEKATANAPLILETEDALHITKITHEMHRRNIAFKAKNESEQLYVKNVSAKDGLSEVAAREMAEILGFGGLIPSNTIARADVLQDHEDGATQNGLVFSREKIKKVIDEKNDTLLDGKKIKNTAGVQNAVAKFIFNLKTAAYRTKAKKEEQFKLLHIQKMVPDAQDGIQWFSKLFNEAYVPPGYQYTGGPTELEKKEQLEEAKKTIQNISLPSFQKNFLLHLILGSQDANPGNTLFTTGTDDVVTIHSIDHERIMPEDNYNITKKMPMMNGQETAVEKDIANVFPIRLWLAGLPQADVPFSKEIIEQALDTLDTKRLLAYHRQKKLFSSAAVGAQLDRVLLIKEVFEAELKKSEVTLTPKELFLKFVNNHPTYLFLKDECQFSDISTFMQLGQIPEGADLNLLRHPLQCFPMAGMILEAQTRIRQGETSPFSEESFKSSHAHHVMFFSNAQQQKMVEGVNQAGLDILAQTSMKF